MKKLFAVLAFVLAASVASAGTVVISIPTTAAQDAKLDRLLVNVNVLRVEAGLPEFATFNEYAEYIFTEQLKGYVKRMIADEEAEISGAYSAAAPATQASVRSLLGLP